MPIWLWYQYFDHMAIRLIAITKQEYPSKWKGILISKGLKVYLNVYLIILSTESRTLSKIAKASNNSFSVMINGGATITIFSWL